MAYSPPRWLESLAGALVPPSCAEHALGDLAECSRSNHDYVRHLVSILLRAIWSQIRRRATIGGLVFNAILTTLLLPRFRAAPMRRSLQDPGRRDVRRLVPLWYLLLLVPGIVWIAASKWNTAPVPWAIPSVLGIFGVIWLMNVKAAQRLDGELQKVDALEGQL